jgi:hypothetical protein
MAQMMGDYHRNVESVQEIHDTVGILTLRRKNGGRVLLAPVDYVFWTERLAGKVNRMEQVLAKDASVTSKELWIAGRFDDVAKNEFEGRGWKVIENANNRLLKK